MPVDHYENFPVASLLVPRRLRQPIEAIYRFARYADDVADEGDAPAAPRLAELQRLDATLTQMAQCGPPPDDLEPIFTPLAAAVAAHHLPLQPFRDLLSAFAQDVVTPRYADYASLLDYCRRSANPVGRLVLHLFGRTEPAHLAQSDAICTALQLTNFWQDVGIDWQKNRYGETTGRIYLPQEDMARFGVTEADLARGVADDRFCALLAFEVARTRALFDAGRPLLGALSGRLKWEIALTLAGGERILDKIQANAYDVFARRPTLGAGDWFRLLASALLR